MAEENTTQQAISSLTYPTIDELRAPTPTTTTPQTPKEDLVYYQISEDPGAPLIEFRKDQSPEEIDQYLQSKELANNLFSQGYLYYPGLSAEDRLPAQKIKAPSLEQIGIASRGFDKGFDFIKQTVPSVKNFFSDVINDKEGMEQAQKTLELYKLQAAAKQYFTDDEGTVRPYEVSVDKILESDEQLTEFTRFAKDTLGNAAATGIPLALVGLTTAALGAPAFVTAASVFAAGALLGIGDVRQSQLEITDDPNAAATLSYGLVYGAVESVFGAPGRFTRSITKGLGKEVLDQPVKKKLFSTVGKEVAKTSALEGVTEATQESLVSAAEAGEQGLSLKEKFANPEVIKGLRDSFIAGTIGGSPFGAAAGVSQYAGQQPGQKNNFTSDSILPENDPIVNEYVGKRYTAKSFPDAYDADDNIINDKDGNPYVPTYELKEVVNNKGVTYAILTHTNPNVSIENPILTIPIDQLNSELTEYVPPVVEEKAPVNPKAEITGVTAEQAEKINIDVEKGVPFQEALKKNAPGAVYVETEKEKTDREYNSQEYPQHNANTVKAAKKRLKERGYSNVDKLSADDAIVIAEDNRNEVSVKEREALENLGYFKGPNGASFIERLESNVEIGSSGKTKGRELIETIIKNKKAFAPEEVVNRYQSGERVIPKLSENEARKAGYSLGFIEDYKRSDYNRDLRSLNDLISNESNPEELRRIKKQKRDLISAYRLKNTEAVDRYNRLRALVTGRGAQSLPNNINQIKELPAYTRGLINRIQTIQNTTNITPEDKQFQIEETSKLLEEALQLRSDLDQLLVTLGSDILTDQEVSNLNLGSISKIEKDIKGKTTPIYTKEIAKLWSIPAGNPRLKQDFADSLPKLFESLRAELDRLGLDTVQLDVVNQFLTKEGGTPLNGAYLVDSTVIEAGIRLRSIGIKVKEGMSIDRALETTPDVDINETILISRTAVSPLEEIGIKADPRIYTLHHEAMHAFFNNGFFTPKEKQILLKYAKNSWINNFKIKTRYSNLTAEQQLEEAISDTFAAYMAGQYKPRGVVAVALSRLKSYLNALSNALFNTGYNDPYKIFEALDLGIIQKRKAKDRKIVLEKTLQENRYEILKMNQTNFQKWFGNSVIKGGNEAAAKRTGASTLNSAVSITLNTVKSKDEQRKMNNIFEDLGFIELPRAVSNLFDIMNYLSGSGRPDGLPNYDDVVEMDSLIYQVTDSLINSTEIQDSEYITDIGSRVTEDVLQRLNIIDRLTLPAQQRNVITLLKDLLSTGRYDPVVTSGLVAKLNADRITFEDIDNANTPLIVYHATYDGEFDAFDPNKYLDFFFHVGTHNQAKARLKATQNVRGNNRLSQPTLIPLMVSIKNPVRIKDDGNFEARAVLNQLTKDEGVNTKEAQYKITNSVKTIPTELTVGGLSRVNTQDITTKIFTQAEADKIQLDFMRVTAKYDKMFDKLQEKIETMSDPYEAQQFGQSALEGGKAKRDFEHDQILKKAIQAKGYDGIVYRNDYEANLENNILEDSYIIFEPIQAKHVDNSGNYDLTNPNFKASVQFQEDPSDLEIDKPIIQNRSQLRQQYLQMKNMIKQDNLFNSQTGQAFDEIDAAKKLGLFNRILSHPRIWMNKNPIFAPLYQAVTNRQDKAARLQFNFVEKLNFNFIPAMRDPETRLNLEKALEMTLQVPGRYRPNENGEIIFTAVEDGKAAGSTVKKGEVVILKDDAALAYLDVQEAFALQHAEIIKGLMSNENVFNMIKQSITMLRAFRPDLANNPILSYKEDQYENFTFNEIKFLIDELKNPGTFLQEGGTFDKASFNLAANILGKKLKDSAGNPTIGAGLESLITELTKYEQFKQTDYVPLQRYGNYFIAVKDTKGNLLEYRLFNRGKFGGVFLNEEPDVRKELQERHPGIDISLIQSDKVTIANLRNKVSADLATIDSIAQFLSDVNADKYVEVRKELDTLVNKKVGADIKGYSIFLKPRKEQGGVPGFSTDFARAISQYGAVSSELAAKNRYNSTIQNRKKYIDLNSNDETLKKATQDWLGYTEDPKQEYASLRRVGFWWYLGGNMSSALLQTATLLQLSGPYMSEFAGTPKTVKELGKALNDVRKMFIFRNRKFQDVFLDFTKIPDDFGTGLKQALLEDIANGRIKQGQALKEAGIPTGQVSTRVRGQIRNAVKTTENTLIGGLFNTFETFSRLNAYVAMFRLSQDPKVLEKFDDFNSAYPEYRQMVKENGGKPSPQIAARWVLNENFGVYGKGNRPWYGQGIGSVVFLFSTYISQAFSHMYRMATHSGGKGNRRFVGQKIFAKQMAGILATGGLVAMPLVDDGTWLYDFIKKTFSGVDRDTKQEIRNYFAEYGVGAGTIEAFEKGLINKAFGIDLSRRLQFNLPGMQQAKGVAELFGVGTGSSIVEATGAPGSMIIGNLKGAIQDIKNEGQFNADVAFKILTNRAVPTFIKNFITGIRYLGGKPVVNNYGTLLIDDPTFYEALMKGIGFNPVRLSKANEANRLERLNGGRTSEVRKRYNNRIKSMFRKLLIGIKTEDLDMQIDAQDMQAEILQDLMKTYSNIEPNLRWSPDIDRLLDEVIQGLNTEYRLTKKDAYQLLEGLEDRRNLNLN
tara:strand:+ start:3423 stop:11210 length:7788 start_codon:yes stop_codon:yes gene_type:complete